jgi:Cu/Ag efflux protein CusF
MAAMVMNYLVTPPTLLEGLMPGRKIRFTIDEDQRAIVRITPLTQ